MLDVAHLRERRDESDVAQAGDLLAAVIGQVEFGVGLHAGRDGFGQCAPADRHPIGFGRVRLRPGGDVENGNRPESTLS
jgi:hypothetical protein